MTAVCPDVHTLAALLESEAVDAGAEYAEHLGTCQHCQQALANLAADDWSWQELIRYLPHREDDFPARSSVLERGIVRFKNEIPFLLKTAESEAEEPLSLSFLRAADRPELLGYLGEYEVLEVIGRGGMGVVFKAFDPALRRLVAIKVMAAGVAGSGKPRQRFKREAQAAAAVCHEHIVPVYAVNEQDGLPYLVMQYVAGESLQARLNHTGPLSVEDIVQIALQTASGLAAAHAQGLIHRDIKPANLLLENGLTRAKIADFGLARMTDDVQLTQNGVVTGTPEYMAPEQAFGASVDHRADLFSLGSVLYALCTGVPPFRGSAAVAVLCQVNDVTPTPIRQLNPDIPVWLETLIARLMAKKPADRFQSAGEVLALLEAYRAHRNQPTLFALPPLLPTSGANGPSGGFRRRWRLALTTGLLVLVLLTTWLIRGLLSQPQAPVVPSSSGDFYQDFRGGKGPLPPLKLFGADAEELTRTEEKGLRITVPRNRKQTDRVGLEWTTPVKGDFEITSSYEILQADVPTSGHGVGFDLFVEIASPRHDVAEVMRICRVNEGEVYTCARISMDDQGKRTFHHDFFETTAKSGRLRLSRSGKEVTLWASEGATGEFVELTRYDFGTEDVQSLKVVAFPGYAQNFLDLRIHDLRIHPLTPAEVRAQENLAEHSSGHWGGWLTIAGVLGLIIVMTLLGVGYVVLRSRRVAPEVLENSSNGKPVESEEAAVIALQCPGCKKGLKARRYLAGKKVRCPYCGFAVPVLAAEKDPAIQTPDQ